MAHRSPRNGAGMAGRRVYELKVSLASGPVTEEFAEGNPVVSRTIQVRGDQTLAALHEAIFDAFDREEEHMFEFQVGGREPMDPQARRYALPEGGDGLFGDEKPAGLVTRTRIDDLGLKERQVFWYWFDFGDDWWHQIDTVAIRDAEPAAKYPRVTAKIGESPPQYPDWEDEDEEEFDDDDEEEDEEGDADEGGPL